MSLYPAFNTQFRKVAAQLLLIGSVLGLTLTIANADEVLDQHSDAQRIISTDGSLTEIVFALGKGDQLVGVDTTSNYPASAMTLPQVGYKRALSAEGVLSLMPDLVLATDDSGPATVLQQLKSAGVNFKTFSSKPELRSVKDKILGVASALNTPVAGAQLWGEVAAQIEQAMLRPLPKKHLKVLFVLSFSDRSPMVAGSSTSADTMITLAGGVNAASALEGYKAISTEALISLAPDIILMMDGRHPSMDANSLFAQEGFNQTPAALTRRLVILDGMLMLGFGPRTGEAILALQKAFYPEMMHSDASTVEGLLR